MGGTDIMEAGLFKPKLLRRARISRILEEMLRVPLFLIVSSMGYGKSTAAREFLNAQSGLTYAWFSLSSCEEDERWMWQKFSVCLKEINPDVSKRLAQYGLPETAMDMERVIQIIASAITKQTVIVFDDYHENKSGHMNRLITAITRMSIPNLHLVVLSRSYPDLPVEELALKGLCLDISQNVFEFDYKETAELFALNGFHLNDGKKAQLYRITDGWTAAIYLALLKYAEDRTLDDIPEIIRLMKNAVYDKFQQETQQVLLTLSFIDDFTIEGAANITGNRRAGELIRQIAANNCFIRYDNKNRTYSIHAILKSLLQDIFSSSELDKYAVLKRCGDYCAEHDRRIEAIEFYHQTGASEEILDIMESPGFQSFFYRAPRTMIRAFNSMEKDLRFSRPLAYLTYIYCSLGSDNAGEGAGAFIRSQGPL